MLARNDSDASLCCPKGASCRFYTPCFWRCEPDWYTHPKDAPRDQCDPTPSPINVTVTASYRYVGINCSAVDLTVYEAALEEQADKVVEAAGGDLEDVFVTCTDVLPNQGSGRRHLLEATDAVDIGVTYVVVPKDGSDFAPNQDDALAAAVEIGVIKNTEVAVNALDEASELEREDLVSVSGRYACVSDGVDLCQA